MKASYVNLIGVVVAAFALVSIEGYPIYQMRIPNGDRVPNPCNHSTIWPGIGHQDSSGGGPRNPFGLDFNANGLVWNATICNQDSDGDGLTNGYELGDPHCQWTMNSTAMNPPYSHPGVCEPLDKPDCISKNIWLMNCKPATFVCPAINDPGVKSYDARLPLSPIPVQETTYICYQFALPIDTISDIIAFEPILDNVHFVHHMELLACTDMPTDHQNNQTFYCGMTPSCTALIAGWGVGAPGQCLDPRMGFRIGPGGFRYGILQVHWNNHDLMTGQTDSSGLRIIYTASLRPNRGHIMTTGQTYLEIPAGTPNVVFTGGCSSNCTRQLPQSVYISTSALHMHLIGNSGNITLYRNGTYLRTIQDVRSYDFNARETVIFPDLIEVRPGDDLRMTCVYDSTAKMTTTYYGEATSDEMCHGILSYFTLTPLLGVCTTWKTIEVCNPSSYLYSDCDLTTFLQLVTVVPFLCSSNCSAPACMVVMDGIYDTGCPKYPDTIQFLSHFFYPEVLLSNDTTFFICLQTVQPPESQV